MVDAFDAVRGASPATGARGRLPVAGGAPPTVAPARAAEVASLISRAERHALGLEFLARGAHDAVAVTFGVHAFVVDAARDHLRAAGRIA